MKSECSAVTTKRLLMGVVGFALLTWIGYAHATAAPDERLMQAASAGNFTRVKSLLDRGADVNAKDSRFGETALMSAARWGHLNVVELPVGNDADVNAKDKHDRTACEIGNQAGRYGIVQILGRQRADKDNARYPDTPEGVVQAYVDAGFVKPINGSYEVKEQQRYIWDYFFPGYDSVSVISGYKMTKISENIQEAQIKVIYDDIGAFCLQCPVHLTLREKQEKTVM
jgi:ankyrin repeat protein